MTNRVLAERLQKAVTDSAVAARERIVVQRPFRTPDQRGGALIMWANLTGLWGVVDMAPPRQVWPSQNGNDVAVWIASDYHGGIEPGFRVIIRGDIFTIHEVVCVHEQQPGMWLRVARGDRMGERGVA
jgi:hypothetical protein